MTAVSTMSRAHFYHTKQLKNLQCIAFSQTSLAENISNLYGDQQTMGYF